VAEEKYLVRVRDLMSAPLVFIDPEALVIDAAKLMDTKRISSVLVRQGEEQFGIITARDVISRVVCKGLDPGKTRVRDVMSHPLLTIGEHATVEDAAKKMRDNSVRRLVVERDHDKVGIVAESDIVRVAPELHFLIREQSRLDARPSSKEPDRVVLSGFCEECGNYSSVLTNLNSMWLCQDCMESTRSRDRC
jgi:signal-transduction protein with cAMP-binding, CBS, and nucleotidyltransferase domain